MPSTDQLFKPIQLGKQVLQHRVALAPLTRLRNVEYVPTKPYQPTYYEQRASKGGLLITEATIVTPGGGSYKLAPGIWNSEQVEGWKKITKAVHEKDGIIYCQLWHLGRASAATYEYKGTKYPPVSASATKVNEKAEVSKELTVEEIKEIVEAFGNASKLSIEAGFDGVEIHGANGYLIDQFLQDVSNHRQDNYGGSLENRLRFAFEVVEACVKAIGEERVSIRFSPFSEFQGMKMEKPYDTFVPYIKELISRYPNLSYIHGVESRIAGSDDKKAEDVDEKESLQPFRDIVEESNKKNQSGSGVRFITAGGCTPENALQGAEDHPNDLFAFGRHFISNPDLPARIQNRWPLNPYDRSTFYTQDERGYTDQPFYKESVQAEAHIQS